MQIILLDMDILVYQIAFSVETPIYVVKGGIYKTRGQAVAQARRKDAEIFKRINIGSKQEVENKLNLKMAEIFEALGTNRCQGYITASKVKENFRSKIATILPYKGNRVNVRKPFHYNFVRELLEKDYKGILVHGQEADDQLAIEQMKAFNKYKAYETTIIATIDKDLKTVPGNHYNLNTQVIDFVTEDEALRNFFSQLLKGDTADNIPGIGRLLKIKGREEEAKKLASSKYLAKYQAASIDLSLNECYNYILDIYKSYEFGEAELGEIWNLLWLRRYEGQDGWKDFKEGKLVV